MHAVAILIYSQKLIFTIRQRTYDYSQYNYALRRILSPAQKETHTNELKGKKQDRSVKARMWV